MPWIVLPVMGHSNSTRKFLKVHVSPVGRNRRCGGPLARGATSMTAVQLTRRGLLDRTKRVVECSMLGPHAQAQKGEGTLIDA